jgi:hypothetical protein
MGCDVTGDEARAALDPRLLDICREWLSIESTIDTQDGNADVWREQVNRLLRLAYEAGRTLGVEEERVKCKAWAERRTFTVKL